MGPTNWSRKPLLDAVGEIALKVYDRGVWNDLAHLARDYDFPMDLMVHYFIVRCLSKDMGYVRWRREQEERDPDMRAIREFLESQDEETMEKLRRGREDVEAMEELRRIV